MNTVELRDVVLGFAGVPVVRGINLEVKAGEVVALLGPNGAGKSTTLAATAGVIRAMSGDITVLGHAVVGTKSFLTARRGAAFVPDDRSLFPSLTVKENLRLGGYACRGERRGHYSLDRALEYFPALGSLLNRRAGLLSGGEQQMLALGRALATSPRVLMIDEMTMGLAPVIASSLMPAIRRMAGELGTSILLVEQHVDLALEMADRAYVLAHGEIVLQGRAADLRKRRDLLKASYLGDAAYEELKDGQV